MNYNCRIGYPIYRCVLCDTVIYEKREIDVETFFFFKENPDVDRLDEKDIEREIIHYCEDGSLSIAYICGFLPKELAIRVLQESEQGKETN